VAEGWRDRNSLEAEILEHMLSVDFPGADVLRLQLPGLQVREIAGEKSLELNVLNQVRTIVTARVPVKAEYCDDQPYEATGQVHVQILLHVNGGLISELQFLKDDGTSIQRMPDPAELQIFALEYVDND
jgi:hypothetical protein